MRPTLAKKILILGALFLAALGFTYLKTRVSERPTMATTQTTSQIVTDIDTFVAAQNENRGKTLVGDSTLPLDYNALSTAPIAGENAVSGIAGISTAGQTLALPANQPGNAVIFDGVISTSASTTGAHNYSIVVDSSGTITATDDNTNITETITGASYLLFDGAVTISSGAYQEPYLIESGTNAQIAEMYNAAFGRVPDLPGLEFYSIPVSTGAMTLHQAAIYFLASPEFATLYPALTSPADNGGVSDQAFITELYGQILHRTPTTDEVNFYVQALQGTLTTSSGAAIPAADRAQLLIYFSISPENQSDVSATNGGWLIDTSKGTTSLGAMSTSTAQTILTNQIAAGTVDASSYSGLPTSDKISVTTSTGQNVTIIGGEYGAGSAAQQTVPEITTQAANIIINLSSEIYAGGIYGQNDTLNGPSTGGGMFLLASAAEFSVYANVGGTANMFGNQNWIQFGNSTVANSVPVTVNGWNSTDIIVDENALMPSYAHTAASILASPNGHIYQASASAPVSGTAISTGANAINVGAITGDTVATIVTAANAVFHENGATLTDNMSYSVYFYGQDPQGNTMVWYWRGDTNGTGSVQASDITGGIELVGVQASSLTGTNFHH